ncbi:MAG: serine/threonine-protein kinase [Candidatus Melainabacteria bacterium]|nr:serine/threonine-protein kinase [Candidatus Melainabacteria bacterium]
MQDESRASSNLPQSALGEFEPGFTAFDNYLISGKLGEGGMGIVYQATNVLLNRIEALKVMPVDAFGPNDVLRFQNEARMMSRLEHANIARVYDFGIGEGQRPYLSMEFIEGDTLQESIDKSGPLPLDLFFEVFIQICRGLAHAHDKGVVHRDVKMSNIMLSVDETQALRAVLLDFGVAKMSSDDGSGRLTKAGSMIGSPLYISPEQIAGDTATPASDMYSLSCVMFCALTGEPPFNGDTVFETLSMHREAAVPIADLEDVEGMFPALRDLIVKGLSKSPDARQQSMKEVTGKLIECAAQLPDTEDGADGGGGLTTSTNLDPDNLFGVPSEVISDSASQILSQTATKQLSKTGAPFQSKTFLYVCLACFFAMGIAFGAIVIHDARTTGSKPVPKAELVPDSVEDELNQNKAQLRKIPAMKQLETNTENFLDDHFGRGGGVDKIFTNQ